MEEFNWYGDVKPTKLVEDFLKYSNDNYEYGQKMKRLLYTDVELHVISKSNDKDHLDTDIMIDDDEVFVFIGFDIVRRMKIEYLHPDLVRDLKKLKEVD